MVYYWCVLGLCFVNSQSSLGYFRLSYFRVGFFVFNGRFLLSSFLGVRRSFGWPVGWNIFCRLFSCGSITRSGCLFWGRLDCFLGLRLRSCLYCCWRYSVCFCEESIPPVANGVWATNTNCISHSLIGRFFLLCYWGVLLHFTHLRESLSVAILIVTELLTTMAM